MPGYEDLTPNQIIYLARLFVLGCALIAISKFFPAILEYRAMKYLSVKIEQKIEGEEVKAPPIVSIIKIILEWRKKKKSLIRILPPQYIQSKENES